MRRTSLVLAVVAAMVTVLAFTAPAFAVELPGASDPSGPGGIQPPGAGGIDDVENRPDNPSPDGLGGGHDPQAPVGTTGQLASGFATTETDVFDAPPGNHIIEATKCTPGEIIRRTGPPCD